MMKHRLLPALAALCVTTLLTTSATAEVLHRERSLYQTILVTRDNDRICLQFSVRRAQRSQSCRDPSDPYRLVFTYSRMTMAALLLKPDPESILIVGLGGGTLPKTFNELIPNVDIDIVEIDEAVIRVAREYFAFRAKPSMRIAPRDARVFIKRKLTEGRKYDLIVLDAYNGDYIPEHLLTREFLEETRELLSDDGVVAANTFVTSALYDHESTTYRAVFGPFFNFKHPTSSNRIIFATKSGLPSQETLNANAESWSKRLERYEVPITDYPPFLTTDIDWDPGKRILTDQYSPANLLRERRRN